MRSLLVLFYSDTLFLEATSTSKMCVMLLSLFFSGMGNIRLLRNYNLHLLTISEMLFTRGHGDTHGSEFTVVNLLDPNSRKIG